MAHGREGKVLKRLMLEATGAGNRLFRNNCGAFQDKRGHWVRYGVANPGGSDLIGWTTTEVTLDMVGKKLAVFTAVEVKSKGLHITSEQERFLAAVRLAGGIGKVELGGDDERGEMGLGSGAGKTQPAD